ncbi:Zn-dependent protease [Pseudomonas aeruginosa]|uniref:TldD/PmbA family protein n=1 Tax=Pseudomonas aeruginosa group TaxID=136841 RepID=UPI00071B65A3|nr:MULTISPECIES: TldD/PmbA family protein [Pseudomonas aeruginosa group]KSP85546.1 Zn-dependent protease [Pseudomonas aeruginosa]MCW8021120.1 TldD/PmbA family protein [Pseudomonas aeruginosa]RTT35237.1 TldD/PmbA family protein [Pseudomonas paraeruginosa]
MQQRQHFEALAEDLRRQLAEGEDFTLWYSAEDSEFIRFNRARVRQAGRVHQATTLLRLIRDERQASLDLTLSGIPEEDRQRLGDGLRQLRRSLAWIPADPYLLLDTTPWQRLDESLGEPPDSGELLAGIERQARDLDLVGIYAAGPLFRGFANSWGAFGWHAGSSFNFDWSLFHANGQAVKADYAGQRWDGERFARRFEQAREQLGHLGKPVRQLKPGDYRAYLAPAALEEVLQMLCWGGFSARALATGESPLQRLHNGDALLSPLLNLGERPAGSPSPAFSAEGSPRADVELIGGGRPGGRLVSSRSAREYGLQANGADAGEAPSALDMAGGSLEQERILAALDTGLYIGNLWYLNYSDMPAARLTGLTRFATFWVENGRIQAPVSTMRFDDSLYSFLGAHLEDLSHERELRLSNSTYGERHTDSMHLPGALTGRFTLTL